MCCCLSIMIPVKNLSSIPKSPTLEIRALAEQIKSQGTKLYDFGVGEMVPETQVPQQFKDEMINAIQQNKTTYCSSQGTRDVLKALSDDFKTNFALDYSPDQICMFPGPKDALWKVLLSILDANSQCNEVVAFAPYYEAFVSPPQLITGKPTILIDTDENCYPNVAEFEKYLSENHHKIAVIIINSPNNPSGVVYPSDILQKLAEIIKRYPHIAVLSDEVYRTFIYSVEYSGSKRRDVKEFISDSMAYYLPDQTIIMGGISKEIAGTGLRLGFAAGPKHVIDVAQELNGHTCSCTSSPLQIAYARFLEKDRDMTERKRIFDAMKKKRDLVVDCLRNYNGLKELKIQEPNGAFYFFPNIKSLFGKKTPQGQVIEHDLQLSIYILEEAKVVTIPGSKFGKPGYLRLSYANSSVETIKEGLQKLSEAIEKLR
eukprot:TRINITY_DN7955_c0_g1_i2.p1 TRINITY_DN7955_c0_g1~~TRINITY_DN7955_c0_g1_i2.p1  ORF type:complete len:429 (-),score=56.40 TRINITY_DN7955_c0_g1_i2:73-1359(-)